MSGATRNQIEDQISDLDKSFNTRTSMYQFPIILGTDVVDQPDIYGRVGNLLIADRAYTVTKIGAVHNVVQTSADGASISVFKAAGTTTPQAATLNLITDTAFDGNDAKFLGFNLKGIAVNVVTDCTLTTYAHSLRLEAGDRLVYGCRGTITSTTIVLAVQLTQV